MRVPFAPLAFAVAVSLGSPGLSGPVELTPDQMLQLSLRMIGEGHPDQALRFSDALVRRNPNDVSALIVKSRAQRDLGDYPGATATARRAWRLSDTPREEFNAAMAVAQGLASDGSKFRAQFWLRRAIEVAPDARTAQAAQRDFTYVRARSRLSLRFDLSVRPSSNVNGGTSADTLDFYGIPLTISPDAKALSGGIAQGALTARWRTLESDTAKTDLRFGVLQQVAILSDKSRHEAPMAKGSDYDYASVELGVDQAFKRWGGEVTATATLGHNWYGGTDMSNYGRVELGYSHGLGQGIVGSIGMNLERQDRQDMDRRSATIAGIEVGAQKRLANSDLIRLQLSGYNSQSEAAEIDHRSIGADLDWVRAKPVWGAGLSLGLSAEMRDYDHSPFDPDGRQDVRLGTQMSVALNGLDYMGFVPVVTLQAQKVQSNVPLYRSDTVGIGITIRSRF